MAGGSDALKLALLVATLALATWAYAAVSGGFDPFGARERAPIEETSQGR